MRHQIGGDECDAFRVAHQRIQCGALGFELLLQFLALGDFLGRPNRKITQTLAVMHPHRGRLPSYSEGLGPSLLMERIFAKLIHHVGLEARAFVDAQKIYSSIGQKSHTGKSLQ